MQQMAKKRMKLWTKRMTKRRFVVLHATGQHASWLVQLLFHLNYVALATSGTCIMPVRIAPKGKSDIPRMDARRLATSATMVSKRTCVDLIVIKFKVNCCSNINAN